MRNTLPNKPKINECGIINLNKSSENGSHWTAYIKKDNYVEYFDSFGNSNPPLELQKYFNNINNIWLNKNHTQTIHDPPVCGFECINWLIERSNFLFI